GEHIEAGVPSPVTGQQGNRAPGRIPNKVMAQREDHAPTILKPWLTGIAGEDRVVQQGGRSWSAENGTTQESFTSQAPTGIVSQGTTAQKEDPPVENGGPSQATLDIRRVAGEGGIDHVERAAVTDGTRAAPYPSAVFEKRAGRDRHGAPVEDRARPFGAVM